MINQIQDYRNSVEQENKMKPRLYTFPNWNESTTVFDYDDLNPDSLLVLCVRAQFNQPGHEQHRVFVWKGSEFDEEEAENEVISIDEFKQRAIESYWGFKNPQDQLNIQFFDELQDQESDDFNELL